MTTCEEVYNVEIFVDKYVDKLKNGKNCINTPCSL